MKRILFLLMVLVLVMVIAPAAFAADNDYCFLHQPHEYKGNPATCTEPGNIPYVQCENCLAYYNEAGEEITFEETIILPLGHERPLKFEATPATCTEAGCIEFYVCEACGTYLLKDEENETWVETTREEVVILPLGHERPLKFDELRPTCTEAGHVEFFVCEACGTYLLKDEENQKWIETTREEVVILPLGHERPLKFEATPATCTEAGCIEFYVCEACGTYLLKDEENQKWIETTREEVVILPLGHERPLKFEATPATCTEAGCIEFFVCEACGTYLLKDEENQTWIETTREEVVILPLGHERPLKFEELLPTCTESGHIEFYVCEACGTYLLKDEENQKWIETTREEVIRMPLGHERPLKFDELRPTCTEAGHVEFYVCEVCGKYLLKDNENQTWIETTREDVVILPLGHERPLKFEALDATHTTVGHIEFYVCEACGTYLLKDDENQAWIETTREEILIPAEGHEGEWLPERPATETDPGTISCFFCYECNGFFDGEGPDAYQYSDDELIVYYNHELKPVEAKLPTCTEAGNIAYWYCAHCQKYYEDEAGEVELTADEVKILPLGHERPLKFDELLPTCTEAGHVEFYVCEACGTYLLKDELNQTWVETTREDVVILPLGHERPLKFDELRPTCTEAGHVEFYVCEACGKYLLKDNENQTWIETTREEVVILPLGHERPLKFEATPATCTEAGCIEFYVCEACGTYLLKDEENQKWIETTREEVVILPIGHERIEKVEAVKPTATTEGMKEHYYCSKCDKYFADRAGQEEVTKESLVIPELGGEDVPPFGDETMIVMFALIVMSVMGFACVTVLKKRSI